MEEKISINNDCYDDFGSTWYEGNAHPVALLRAEHKCRQPWILQTLKNHFGNNSTKILDIGCGGGLVSNALAEQGHEVTGIDISLPSLEIAKEKDSTKTVTYLQADATKLPFPEENFDVVSAMDFLEHVDNPHEIIHQAARVLKPQGLFFFHTFNRTVLSYLTVIKGVEWFVKNTPKNLHVYHLFVKPQELSKMSLENGLHVRDIFGLVPKFSLPLLKMICTRKVPSNLKFHFVSSLKCGYVGYAIKSDRETK